MKPEKIINWKALSKALTGDKKAIRKNKIPQKHSQFIHNLIYKMNEAILHGNIE